MPSTRKKTKERAASLSAGAADSPSGAAMNRGSDRLFTDERRAHILQILEQEHRASVTDLANRFDVSEDTVRRDLRDLEARGQIRKTHGGALRHTTPPVPYERRLVQSSELKEMLGRRAAEVVQEGDSMIIDGATTAVWVARALRVARAKVLTNSLEVASVVADFPHIELTVLGGRWDPLHRQLVGQATIEQISRYRVDKLFLGMGALDRKSGLTEPTEEDAAVKRAMVGVAQQVIGLADHSKLGTVSFACVGPASVIDVLVTDDLADCTPFEDLDWEVIRVPLPKAVA
jgi:DeoR/GlpR family transcriptional regulator of sugar metabolism